MCFDVYHTQVTPAMEAFTKEVFSGQAMRGEGQAAQQGPEWQQQQATYTEHGKTIIMNSEKAKQQKKKEQQQKKATAAAKLAAAGASGAAGEL